MMTEKPAARPGRRGRTNLPPAGVHPFVRLVYLEAIRRDMTLAEIEKAARVSRHSIRTWRRDTKPKLESIERVLRAVGFEIVVRPVGAGRTASKGDTA